MFKNFTPRQISLFAAIIITIICTFILFIFQSLHLINVKSTAWLYIVIAVGIISYLVILYFIKRFIFRRIKLIYKIIHDNKVSVSKDRQEVKELLTSGINDVGEQVSDWVHKQQITIENLQSMENYRRDFLGNVSHELKTPIFNIQGYIHTLIDGAIDDPNLVKKYLDRAAKNVERLQTIVEDLESISKLELGEMVLEISKFDIKKLAEEVLEELEFKASEKNIVMHFKEGASHSFHVLADREYIRQVLVNIISNSIKYGVEGGATKVSFYDMDQFILVEISDNGIGIDKQHLKHVFDRFYRIDKSRNRQVGGSGLGLAIVKHIIEAHNQTINIRSTPGLGTTIGFTLKLSRTK